MMVAAWYHFPLALLFVVLAFLVTAVILLQRGRGVGLAGAFGGAGLHTAFGSKTGDVLTWATVVLAGIFLVYAVLLNYLFVPMKAVASNPPAISAPAPGDGTGAAEVPLEEPAEVPPSAETPPPSEAAQPPAEGGAAPASAPSTP